MRPINTTTLKHCFQLGRKAALEKIATPQFSPENVRNIYKQVLSDRKGYGDQREPVDFTEQQLASWLDHEAATRHKLNLQEADAAESSGVPSAVQTAALSALQGGAVGGAISLPAMLLPILRNRRLKALGATAGAGALASMGATAATGGLSEKTRKTRHADFIKRLRDPGTSLQAAEQALWDKTPEQFYGKNW